MRRKEFKEMLEILDLRVNNLKFDISQFFTIYEWVENNTIIDISKDVVVKSQLEHWIDEMFKDIKHLREDLLAFKKKVNSK
jgi:hypothetical protein